MTARFRMRGHRPRLQKTSCNRTPDVSVSGGKVSTTSGLRIIRFGQLSEVTSGDLRVGGEGYEVHSFREGWSSTWHSYCGYRRLHSAAYSWRPGASRSCRATDS